MSYQGAINSAVSSTAGAISIARLVYQNSPEYKAKVEQEAVKTKQRMKEAEKKADEESQYKTLKEKSDTAKDKTGGIGEVVRQEAEKKYLETGDERYQTISEFTRDADEIHEQVLVDQATKAAESGLNAAKSQKRRRNY